MIKYAVCEIGDKQYIVERGKPFEVTAKVDTLQAAVLMTVDDKKVQIGRPYLKEKLKLKILETSKGKKIKVAKYHAKANYRRVRGFRPQISKVVLEA